MAIILAEIHGGSSDGARNLGVAFVVACLVLLGVCYLISRLNDRKDQGRNYLDDDYD